MPMRPNVKLFRTWSAYYAYDVNCNKIIRLSRATYEHMSKLLECCPELGGDRLDVEQWGGKKRNLTQTQIALGIKEFEKIKENHALFHPNQVAKIAYNVSGKQIDEMFQEKCLQQLTLGITEQCNFRCHYCTFDQSQNLQSRAHSDQSMSEDTLVAALDFALEQSVNTKDLCIGFYGGEPLLEFDLIKFGVNYVVRKAKRNIAWQISTNGYLVDNNVIDFFSKHLFNLWISFDGSPKNHDMHRRAVSGESTGWKIIENIDLIRRNYPDYANRHLFFSQLISVDHDYEDFIRNNIAFYGSGRSGKSNLASVRNADWPMGKAWSAGTIEKYNAFLRKYKLRFMEAQINERNRMKFSRASMLFNGLFGHGLYLLATRRSMCPTRNPPMGNCVPGLKKIFVDARGNIQICERIPSFFAIGCVFSGYFLDRIKLLMSSVEELFSISGCRNCWAVRLCNVCYAGLFQLGDLSTDRLSEHCGGFKSRLIDDMRFFCYILENNPNAFIDQLYNHIELVHEDLVKGKGVCDYIK